MFLEDEKLPDDVVRKEYGQTRHALCCLECGFEWEFNPTQTDSIGRPLYVLMEHVCRKNGVDDAGHLAIPPAHGLLWHE
jgi:hypothetical protein